MSWLCLSPGWPEHTDEAGAEKAGAVMFAQRQAKKMIEQRDNLLREFIELCAAGGVNENTESLGWGDLIRRAKEQL
jgi:hypothetical protein